MVRAPCIDKNGMKKGAWSEEEDNKLRDYIERYGHWNWRELPKYAGMIRLHPLSLRITSSNTQICVELFDLLKLKEN